jgi:hypothetical protein
MVRGNRGRESRVAIVGVAVIIEERSLYGIVVVEEMSLKKMMVSLSEGTDRERRRITSIWRDCFLVRGCR